MDFFSILTLLGGLALFLYGMQVMGDGLAKVSGGKLEQILENLTSSKWKAVLLGLCVTAVIQSSSATTVMVVGFVNSGIMKLTQAVGIIMGANIGTTVTSWLLSLTGIESSNFFISLLKPSSFSPVLAMVGIILLTFTKSSRKKDIGTILLEHRERNGYIFYIARYSSIRKASWSAKVYGKRNYERIRDPLITRAVSGCIWNP